MKAIIFGAAIMLSAISAQATNFLSNQEQFISVKPTPVTADFGYFRVHRMAQDAMLNWSVTDPVDVDYFTIERSYDGSYFETIAQVDGTGYATYKYRDNPFPGTIYYRINSVSMTGRGTVTSAIESVRIVVRK